MRLSLHCPGALVANFAAILLITGCTRLIHNDVATKDIFRYKVDAIPARQLVVPARYVAGRGVPRAEVIKRCDIPVATGTFPPSISVKQAYDRRIIPRDDAYYNLAEVEESTTGCSGLNATPHLDGSSLPTGAPRRLMIVP